MDFFGKFVKVLLRFTTATTTRITFATMGTKSVVANTTILFVLQRHLAFRAFFHRYV